MLRNPNSIPAGDILIQDPVMEPFFITKSQSGGYTVYERVEKGETIGIVREDGKAAVMMPADDEHLKIYTDLNDEAP